MIKYSLLIFISKNVVYLGIYIVKIFGVWKLIATVMKIFIHLILFSTGFLNLNVKDTLCLIINIEIQADMTLFSTLKLKKYTHVFNTLIQIHHLYPGVSSYKN